MRARKKKQLSIFLLPAFRCFGQFLRGSTLGKLHGPRQEISASAHLPCVYLGANLRFFLERTRRLVFACLSLSNHTSDLIDSRPILAGTVATSRKDSSSGG